MSRSRKKSKKTPKKASGKPGRPRPVEPAREGAAGAAARPRRRTPVLIVALAGIAIAVALVLLLRDTGDRRDVAEVESAAPAPSDLDLRNEAFHVAQKLIADFPNRADPLGLMGTVQNQFGNSAEAERWWWRCLEMDPRRVDIYEVLAVAYLRKEEYEKVAGLLERAQSLDINLPGVHLRYGEALLELGRLDEAVAMIQEELRLSPNLTECYVAMGKVRFQRKEYDLAVAAYAEATRRRPEVSQPWYGLATASARLGQKEKSREYMARFQELRAVEDEASTTRRRATDKLAPVAQILAQVLVDAARVYEAHGQHDQAEQYWRRAADLDRKNAPSRVKLVNRYRSTQRGWEAVEVCKELQKIDPENANYHLVTGMTLADLKQYDAAVVAISRAAELAPTGRTYYRLGIVCVRNQDRPAALAALKRAAELSPDDEEIQKAYKSVLERQ